MSIEIQRNHFILSGKTATDGIEKKPKIFLAFSAGPALNEVDFGICGFIASLAVEFQSQIGVNEKQQKGNRMNVVKNSLRMAACVGILAASAFSVFGQVGQIITLDEMGGGFITPQQPFTFTVGAVEPNSGLATLRYDLPFAGVAGDVVLQESVGGPYSDVLRFDGQFHVYFFSDKGDGSDSYADQSGLPPNLITPNVGPFLEQGVEGGLQYLYYMPNAGDPGFKAAAPGTIYYIISDVPEPGTVTLAGLGALLLAMRFRRQ